MKSLASYIVAATALCALCSCSPDKRSTIIPDAVVRQCREGDIVLREGTAIESHVVRAANRRSHFTHCGLVARMGGELMVVHAVPDEPDFEGDPDRVKVETIAQFFSTRRAKRGCLLRCRTDSLTARRAAHKALELYRSHTLFDHDYDDSDSTRMYCSELVVFAYAKAGFSFGTLEHNDYNLLTTRLHHVLLPSEFTASRRTTIIAEFGRGDD